jgi:hypothetical protein
MYIMQSLLRRTCKALHRACTHMHSHNASAHTAWALRACVCGSWYLSPVDRMLGHVERIGECQCGGLAEFALISPSIDSIRRDPARAMIPAVSDPSPLLTYRWIP